MSLAQLRREINAIKRKLVHELRVVRPRRVATRCFTLSWTLNIQAA